MMSSAFTPKELGPRHRFEKLPSSSCVGRGGDSAAHAVFVGEHSSSRTLLFRRHVEACLAAGDLGGLYQVWQFWVRRGWGQVPLDNRDMTQLKRRIARIVRGRLQMAVQSDDSDRIREALQVADDMADRFPRASEVKTSLEYLAAKAHDNEPGMVHGVAAKSATHAENKEHPEDICCNEVELTRRAIGAELANDILEDALGELETF